MKGLCKQLQSGGRPSCLVILTVERWQMCLSLVIAYGTR